MKKFFPLFTIFLLFISCEKTHKNKKNIDVPSSSTSEKKKEKQTALIKDTKIKEALLFCKKENLDTGIAFFVDMSIHSGKNRFFVYDFKNNKILYSGLCCHGMGKGSTCTDPVYSNEHGSNCTSIGKYKTGIRSYSNWGIHVHYKLHGLEKSNSNAFKRYVVLHSYKPVPDMQIYPLHLPLGWSLGCPVISNQLMTSIDKLLKSKKKPVLLWIYND